MSAEQLKSVFQFPHIPTGDPAWLLQYIEQFEAPEIREKAFAAVLQLSFDQLTAQIKFVQHLQALAGKAR
jgi:hypothetical protein